MIWTIMTVICVAIVAVLYSCLIIASRSDRMEEENSTDPGRKER